MQRASRTQRHGSRRAPGAFHRRWRRREITFGDLVSAVYEVGGSTLGARRLLSPPSPLCDLLDRRIRFA
jgi:hypothetical protein